MKTGRKSKKKLKKANRKSNFENNLNNRETAEKSGKYVKEPTEKPSKNKPKKYIDVNPESEDDIDPILRDRFEKIGKSPLTHEEIEQMKKDAEPSEDAKKRQESKKQHETNIQNKKKEATEAARQEEEDELKKRQESKKQHEENMKKPKAKKEESFEIKPESEKKGGPQIVKPEPEKKSSNDNYMDETTRSRITAAIQSGEPLSEISRRYDISEEDLEKMKLSMLHSAFNDEDDYTGMSELEIFKAKVAKGNRMNSLSHSKFIRI